MGLFSYVSKIYIHNTYCTHTKIAKREKEKGKGERKGEERKRKKKRRRRKRRRALKSSK